MLYTEPHSTETPASTEVDPDRASRSITTSDSRMEPASPDDNSSDNSSDSHASVNGNSDSSSPSALSAAYDNLSQYLRNMTFDIVDESDDEDTGPTTANGARCLSTTGNANVDLFASGWIFFDGNAVARDVDKNASDLMEALTAAYAEDSKLCTVSYTHLTLPTICSV